MAEKDIAEKLLEDHNDVFADIINGLIFNGECQISESDLEATKTVSQYKAEDIIRSEDRDVSKFWVKKCVKISLIGMENQTDYDPDMVFRRMGYDGASYRDELNHGDERYPVITLVLYFGTDRRWGKNRLSLHDIFKDMPPELKPYVNDYKVHVFEIAWLSDDQVAKFKSDFRIVADYFVQMRKNGEYNPSHENMKHVSEVLRFMEAMSHDRAFQNAQNEFRKGDVKQMSMANWFDKKLDETYERGRADERKDTANWFDKKLDETYERGRADERKDVEKELKTAEIDREKAEANLKRAEEERKKAEEGRRKAEEERKKAEEGRKESEASLISSIKNLMETLNLSANDVMSMMKLSDAKKQALRSLM